LTRLILRDNKLASKSGGEAIADMLKGNSVLTELDLSKNLEFEGCVPAEFAQALSPGIAGNGALTSLNLANNSLGDLVIPEGWTKQLTSDRTGYVYKHLDGTVQGGKPGKPEGVIAIANAIPDMGAMTRLDARENDIDDEGKRALQQAAGSRCRT
jgi:hypothetical protein